MAIKIKVYFKVMKWKWMSYECYEWVMNVKVMNENSFGTYSLFILFFTFNKMFLFLRLLYLKFLFLSDVCLTKHLMLIFNDRRRLRFCLKNTHKHCTKKVTVSYSASRYTTKMEQWQNPKFWHILESKI